MAFPRFVLTVLAASPCVTPVEDVSPTTVVWILDDSALAPGTPFEIHGDPSTATLDGITGLRFDGKDDAIFVASNPIEGASAFTIEALIAPEIGGPSEQRFLHIEDPTPRRVLLETRMIDGKSFAIDTFAYADDQNRRTLIDKSKVHEAGRWHWVAMRYDGTSMAHFVDGVKEAEGTVAMPAMAPGRMSLGVRLNRIYWYAGLIREVRFHRVALPEAELQRP